MLYQNRMLSNDERLDIPVCDQGTIESSAGTCRTKECAIEFHCRCRRLVGAVNNRSTIRCNRNLLGLPCGSERRVESRRCEGQKQHPINLPCTDVVLISNVHNATVIGDCHDIKYCFTSGYHTCQQSSPRWPGKDCSVELVLPIHAFISDIHDAGAVRCYYIVTIDIAVRC